MSYEDIRNARDGAVRANLGDGIVRIESVFLGITALMFSLYKLQMGTIASIVIGLAVAYVFPRLVGFSRIFGWIVNVVFSLIWGALGFWIGGAIFENSWLAGAGIAIIVFCASFYAHKVFMGVGLVSEIEVEQHKMELMEESTENSATMAQDISQIASAMKHTSEQKSEQQTLFCRFCGARVQSDARFCPKCGREQ